MREYRQLTEEDRIEIYAMKQAGKEQNMIAAELGVHPSTLSRSKNLDSQIICKYVLSV
jgi:IS30 family transposase